mgnify:CR=1 FL=1
MENNADYRLVRRLRRALRSAQREYKRCNKNDWWEEKNAREEVEMYRALLTEAVEAAEERGQPP